MNLFKIETAKETFYFEMKSAAKIARDQMAGYGGGLHTIRRGPDHWKGETFGSKGAKNFAEANA